MNKWVRGKIWSVENLFQKVNNRRMKWALKIRLHCRFELQLLLNGRKYHTRAGVTAACLDAPADVAEEVLSSCAKQTQSQGQHLGTRSDCRATHTSASSFCSAFCCCPWQPGSRGDVSECVCYTVACQTFIILVLFAGIFQTCWKRNF